MNDLLERRFAAIGARVKVAKRPWRGTPRIDVRADARGEYFDVQFAGMGGAVGVEVVDVRPDDRHLLLLVRDGEDKTKFLCGHDERHWFVAAVPEKARGVTGVATAKRALQPELVRRRVRAVRPKDPLRRRNTAFVRQGEWFFVPEPRLEPPAAFVLRKEPLSRGQGKPHVMELAYRRGGRTVYVNGRHPTGISEAEYARLSDNQRRGGGWVRMVRDPELFAKGAIRHPDHATVVLDSWHRVMLNTEHEAQGARIVAFLD